MNQNNAIEGNSVESIFHLVLNAYWEPLEFELPPLADGSANSWLRWIDTALESPDDIVPWEEAPAVRGLTYRAEARSGRGALCALERIVTNGELHTETSRRDPNVTKNPRLLGDPQLRKREAIFLRPLRMRVQSAGGPLLP